MTNAYREEIFVIEWLTLPQEQKDYVVECQDHRFSNGVMLEWFTEFQPCSDEADFQDTLTTKQIESYWKDQTETNGFECTLDEFIKEYGLEFEMWVIEQGFDLTGIKRIYFDIKW